MFCSKCGAEIDNQSAVCPKCGTPTASRPDSSGPSVSVNVSPTVPVNVSNHLVGALISLFCCCLPGGIVALVYALQVNNRLAAGDVAGAQAASRTAGLWVTISMVVGLLFSLGYIVFVAFGVLASAAA